MSLSSFRSALIIGAGAGISASLSRRLASEGLRLALVSRGVAKLARLATETGATVFEADAADPSVMEKVFAQAEAELGGPDVVVFNAAARAPGPVGAIDPEAVLGAIRTTAFGGFLAVHQAAKRMVRNGGGAILLTGASASLRGYPNSSAFAMGKFALRGLAQSAARELGPKGVHVAHIIVDGAVRSGSRPDGGFDDTLDPDAIADAYLALLRQPRSAWSFEVDLRPWRESF